MGEFGASPSGLADPREVVADGQGQTTAHVAQLAERVLGKDEVTSSILVVGSNTVDISVARR
jgi:hypothetical protein